MVRGWTRRATALLLLLLLSSACTRSRLATTPTAAVAPETVTTTPISMGAAVAGQTIYVPAYSHIYYQDRERVINLTITLSIRNTDPRHAIRIDSVQYYDANGQLLRNEVAAPLLLAPLATLEFVVEEEDTSGGSGASFLVQWRSDVQPTAPVVEAVMISAASTQGISFVSVGRVIEELTPSVITATTPVTVTE